MVMPSYNSATAFDLDGKPIKEFRGGGDDRHYENFLAAVRSGRPDDLNADIEEGHLSSALCHLGNISYRLGQTMNLDQAREKLASIRSSDDVNETLARTVEHLQDNSVQLQEHPFQVGLHLPINPDTESFRDNAQADQMLTRDYRAPFVVPGPGQV
jgi:hypothetical protein